MAADTFQIKRGTTAAVNAYLPAIGEPVYDITLKKLKIGDGVTLGGVESTPTNANLVALSGLTGTADKGFYFTGVGAMALFDLTPVARALLDDTTTLAQQATLGLVLTTSVTDPTIGRVVKVGDYGWGSPGNASPVYTVTPASVANTSPSLIVQALTTDAQGTVHSPVSGEEFGGVSIVRGIRPAQFGVSGRGATASLWYRGYSTASSLQADWLKAAKAGANSDITSLTGLTTPLSVTQGGTDANTAAGARTNLGLVIGTNVQAWDADLDALAANATSGSWHRTGAGTGAARTLTGTANQITVTNGDGVAGNPTVSFPASMSFAGKTITDGGSVTTVDINGGTVDGTTIGGSSPGAAAFTTVSATGAITPSQTAGIAGTTTNNNVNAGGVGEHITANATAQSIASAGTIINITSISLTAGDWEVSGGVSFTPAGTTTVSQVVGGISTTSVTLPTSDFNLTNLQGSLTTGAKQSFAVPSQRLSLSATTTVYLTATANFGVSTMTAGGIIRARRVR